MSLPRHLFAPAFRHQHLGWFFALIIGITVFLATFAMATESALSAITFTWDQNIENQMTVEIPSADDESFLSQAERIKQVMAVLHAIPEIKQAGAESEDETARLLKPWITQPELLKALPIPTLIDVERQPNSSLTVEDIENKLKPIAANIHVDDNGLWLENITHIVHGLIIIGALMMLLTGIILVIVVSLLCRTIMATERETIYLLHTLGAEDKAIAEHFGLHVRKLSEPAALIGCAGALLCVGTILYGLYRLSEPLMLTWLHWAGLGITTLLVPVVAIWIAAFTARLSSLQLLHALP